MGQDGPSAADPAGETGDGQSVVRLGSTAELVAGAIAGIVAFLGGYVLLFVLRGNELMANFFAGMQSTGADPAQLEAAGLTLPDQWQVVGLVYHSLHNVPYSMAVSVGAQQRTFTFGRGFLAGELLPWLLPMVVLVVAGFAVAYAMNASTSARGAAAGGKVAVGYAIAAVATTFLFTWSASLTRAGISRSISLGPDLVSTLLFAGVVYPLVFAGLGGVLATSLRSPPR